MTKPVKFAMYNFIVKMQNALGLRRVTEKMDTLLFQHIFALAAIDCMKISRST